MPLIRMPVIVCLMFFKSSGELHLSLKALQVLETVEYAANRGAGRLNTENLRTPSHPIVSLYTVTPPTPQSTCKEWRKQRATLRCGAGRWRKR